MAGRQNNHFVMGSFWLVFAAIEPICGKTAA